MSCPVDFHFTVFTSNGRVKSVFVLMGSVQFHKFVHFSAIEIDELQQCQRGKI